MSEWIRLILDLMLIAAIGGGIYQAGRLIKHLAGLQQGRVDMERFVRDFNSTVMRAEAGIKGLKNAARESGDDLEKLAERAGLVRDELSFLVESADQIAERLSQKAGAAIRPESKTADPATDDGKPATSVQPKTSATKTTDTSNSQPSPSSRAEKELLQALQKLS
jgi:hypothetical protein